MQTYTVVLLYPDSMTGGCPETYLAWVDADSPSTAERAAQVQVLRAQSYKGGLKADDFRILHIFKGHVKDTRWTYTINQGR